MPKEPPSIPFDPIADIERQIGDNPNNIHTAEINALLADLGHTLGNEEAAARICQHIPDLEAADEGNFQATQRVMRRLRVMIFDHETGQNEEPDSGSDLRDDLAL